MGQRKPGQSAHDTQQDALGQELADEPGPARTQRRPDRQLPAPGQRPRQDQVGHVRAGDEQHERHGAHQHQQGPA